MDNKREVIHFSDEVTLKIAIENALPSQLRKLIPSSACIIRYEIFSNYSFVTWSVTAREIGFPDATEQKPIRIGKRHDINVYWKNENVFIVTNFAPFKRKNFVLAVESCPSIVVDRIMTYDGLVGFIKCMKSPNTEIDRVTDYLEKIARCYDDEGNPSKDEFLKR